MALDQKHLRSLLLEDQLLRQKDWENIGNYSAAQACQESSLHIAFPSTTALPLVEEEILAIVAGGLIGRGNAKKLSGRVQINF